MRAITKNTLLFIASALILMTLVGLFTVQSNAETPASNEATNVSLQVNGKILSLDVPPQIIDSRTMIPARALFEEVGGDVQWDADNRKVTIQYDQQTVVLTIDSITALVGGESKTLDVPAQIINSRTLIPLRFVSESLGFEVDWDPDSRTAIVDTPADKPDDTPAPPSEPVEPSAKINQISVISGSAANMTTTATIVFDTAITSEDYKAMSLSAPNRYVIDFLNCTAGSEYLETLSTISDLKSAVSSVRCGKFEATTVRLVFDLNEAQTPTINLSSDGKTMTIVFNKNSSHFSPYDDGKLVVVLDPGHGKSTAGKKSPDSSLLEYEFNRSVASKIKTILEDNGIEVIMTVTDDSDPTLAARSATANNSDADIFVSVHANAFGDGVNWENNVSGWEIYYYSTSTYGKKLAEYIHESNVPALGIKDRGVKTANFAVIKNTVIPAVLIEHGFYTNETEIALLKSDSWRQAAAACDAAGIMNFLYSFK